MSDADMIKKKLKKLEERFPESAKDIEHELLPLQGEEVRIKKKKGSDND
jgi:hypothetical protein